MKEAPPSLRQQVNTKALQILSCDYSHLIPLKLGYGSSAYDEEGILIILLTWPNLGNHVEQ